LVTKAMLTRFKRMLEDVNRTGKQIVAENEQLRAQRGGWNNKALSKLRTAVDQLIKGKGKVIATTGEP